MEGVGESRALVDIPFTSQELADIEASTYVDPLDRPHDYAEMENLDAPPLPKYLSQGELRTDWSGTVWGQGREELEDTWDALWRGGGRTRDEIGEAGEDAVDVLVDIATDLTPFLDPFRNLYDWLAKYWWVLALVALFLVTSHGSLPGISGGK